jgi:prepilin peptidase CpaA
VLSGSIGVVNVALAVLVTAVAAFTDFRTGRIPNWLTYGATVAGLLLRTVQIIPHGAGALSALVGMLVCGLVPFLIWRKDGMAGGDVKQFVALGAILGAFHGIEAQFYAYVAGSLLSMGRLAWHGRLLASLVNAFFLALNPVMPRAWRREIRPEMLTRFRLGGSIFAGTCVAALSLYPTV